MSMHNAIFPANDSVNTYVHPLSQFSFPNISPNSIREKHNRRLHLTPQFWQV